jgi:hypothetical protein
MAQKILDIVGSACENLKTTTRDTNDNFIKRISLNLEEQKTKMQFSSPRRKYLVMKHS